MRAPHSELAFSSLAGRALHRRPLSRATMNYNGGCWSAVPFGTRKNSGGLRLAFRNKELGGNCALLRARDHRVLPEAQRCLAASGRHVTQPAAVLKLRSRCLGRQRRQTDALWLLLDA